MLVRGTTEDGRDAFVEVQVYGHTRRLVLIARTHTETFTMGLEVMEARMLRDALLNVVTELERWAGAPTSFADVNALHRGQLPAVTPTALPPPMLPPPRRTKKR